MIALLELKELNNFVLTSLYFFLYFDRIGICRN